MIQVHNILNILPLFLDWRHSSRLKWVPSTPSSLPTIMLTSKFKLSHYLWHPPWRMLGTHDRVYFSQCIMQVYDSHPCFDFIFVLRCDWAASWWYAILICRCQCYGITLVALLMITSRFCWSFYYSSLSFFLQTSSSVTTKSQYCTTRLLT